MVISKTTFFTDKVSISGTTANISLEYGKEEGRLKVLGKERQNILVKSKTTVATESAPVFTPQVESTKDSGSKDATKAQESSHSHAETNLSVFFVTVKNGEGDIF